MTRAYNTATTQQNSGGAVTPFVAGKNFIINGGQDVWQRGTSIATSAAAYTSDRFQTWSTAGAASTTTRQVTGDTTNLPSIQYCARVQRNSGQTATGAIAYQTSLETINSIPLVGKSIVLSFYARAGANYSAASNLLTVKVITGTGTDQNVGGLTGAAEIVSTTATLTTTWQRFQFTATVGISATQIGFQCYSLPTGTAGANDYYEITGIQLELGSVPSTFSRAGGDIQGELAACQRYYQRIGDSIYGIIHGGTGDSGDTSYASYTNLTTMRTAPTTTKVGTWATLNCAQPTVMQTDGKTFSLSTAIQTAVSVQYYFHSNTTTYIELSAEL
jgi:hypothetical protein